MYNSFFNDSILELISITRMARSILSDDGSRGEHRYLGHLLRWSEPRYIYQRRRDSRKISLSPVALVPRLLPYLSPFNVTDPKRKQKRVKCGSRRLCVIQWVCDSGQTTVVGLQWLPPSTLRDTPPFNGPQKMDFYLHF